MLASKGHNKHLLHPKPIEDILQSPYMTGHEFHNEEILKTLAKLTPQNCMITHKSQHYANEENL